jgi:hypothetical protein
LMRVMDIGRQSMYDTFGDKRALFLKALEMYVTESVHSCGFRRCEWSVPTRCE